MEVGKEYIFVHVYVRGEGESDAECFILFYNLNFK